MHDIRTLIGKLNFMGSQRALMGQTRKLALQSAAMFRGPAAKIRSTLEGISETAAFVEAEADSWIEPADVAAGRAGGFDACDLRHWLVIAEKAGAPAVEAREILSLTEDELSAIDQKVAFPGFIRKAIARGMSRAFSTAERAEIEESAEACARQENSIDPARLSEQLHDAMDEVPHDWIVRSNISGPSTLKAFAGAGVLEDGRTSWSPGDTSLEIGPGWVRHGNRRRIDATDARFIETFAQGHKPRIHYLARPWVCAARRVEGPDPHRHGTPFAGKGSWPCEWRVFVENGRVTGVANYYGWAGAATPENAARALEAAALAERMVTAAVTQGLSARWMDLEILRHHTETHLVQGAEGIHPSRLAVLARFPRDAINCTLDFIEVSTDNGPVMTFLEGGPAHTPMGGGHPCAFAGNRVDPAAGLGSDCTGVALKLMEHVMLADPATWSHGETEDRILSWDEARRLAAQG